MLQVALWIGLAVVAVLVGKEVGKRLFAGKKNLTSLKRSSQTLAIALREHGLKRLPEVLEEFTVGDVDDLLTSIKDFATVVKAGNEAIVRELDGTFERMLGVKLRSPEGRAWLKAQLAEAEKVALEVAVPVAAAAVAAAL